MPGVVSVRSVHELGDNDDPSELPVSTARVQTTRNAVLTRAIAHMRRRCRAVSTYSTPSGHARTMSRRPPAKAPRDKYEIQRAMTASALATAVSSSAAAATASPVDASPAEVAVVACVVAVPTAVVAEGSCVVVAVVVSVVPPATVNW